MTSATPERDLTPGWLPRAACALYLLVLLAKVVLASRAELLVDEGFYWQCGERPAIAYVDHPPLTALSVRAGTELAGHTTLGVRLLFLAAAAVFPWLVFAFARAVAGRRDAWLALALTCIVPASAYLGLIAIPDVFILLWTALFLAALERATRGAHIAWLVAGFAGALGLVTHYRFSVECLCGLLFLVATRAGRAQWRRGGPWLAVGIAFLGFAPAVIVNVREDFAPLAYYLEGRHDGGFDPEGWARFVGEQLGVGGFLMLPVFALAFARIVKLARGGDDRAQLALCFAAPPVALFFLASAFETSGLPTLHWPAPAYVPLFAYVPGALREFVARGRQWRIGFARTAVLSSALIVAFLFNELGGPWPVTELRMRHFSGARETARELETRFAGEQSRPMLVADNYEFGARLAFELDSDVELFILDHKANTTHGRGRQYELWGMSERDLPSRAGADAWLVLERGSNSAQSRWIARVRSLFESAEIETEILIENPRRPDEPRLIRIARAHSVRPSAPPR